MWPQCGPIWHAGTDSKEQTTVLHGLRASGSLKSGVVSLVVFSAGLSTVEAAADATAWLPEPQTGYTSLTLVHQSADEFYRADHKQPTPGAADLSQGTAWFNASYALNDGWSVDAQAGWAKSDFVTGPGIPASAASFSGITDATFGVTRRLLDEATGPFPSVAVRLGGIVAGNYQTGQINSLGDGGSGHEVSAVVGKFIGGRLGISAETGYRRRDSGIPDESFFNVSALLLVMDTVTVGVDYRVVDSRSGLDIGEPGFTPPKFPQLEEDYEAIGFRLFFNLGETGLSAFHSRVASGRNTAASSVFGITASRSFSAF